MFDSAIRNLDRAARAVANAERTVADPYIGAKLYDLPGFFEAVADLVDLASSSPESIGGLKRILTEQSNFDHVLHMAKDIVEIAGIAGGREYLDEE